MSKFKLRIAFFVVSSIGLLLFFQNCQKIRVESLDLASVAGAQESENAAAGAGADSTPLDDNLGLKAGHFDFDTASVVYDSNAGTSDRHQHEYDNKFDIRYIDFFNMLDREQTKITSRISPTQEFLITVANAESSPGVLLEINGVTISGVDYQKKVDAFIAGNAAALESFNLGTLNNFKVKFTSDTISEAVLVPIYYKCPIVNKPSSTGQYRNGAFIVQLHDKSAIKLDPVTRVAVKGGGLEWEAFLFWHRDNLCR